MSIFEHRVNVVKNARFFTSGSAKNANHLLIALHGYGHLAQFFLRKFEGLGDDFLIVVPEGLHRFYLNGTSGRVGASWMTKEARESDIEDNQNYIEQIISSITNEKKFDQITLLGFSQGGATAARYFFNKNTKVHNLVLWAAIFPPDLLVENEILNQQNFNGKLSFAVGTGDQYFDKSAQSELIDFYASKNFEVYLFNGKHDIDLNTLKTILA